MRPYDVYEHPVASARWDRLYLVVLSSHLLPDLTQVIVAPLTELKPERLPGLEVQVTIDDRPFVLVTLDLASIVARRLKRRVAGLVDYEDDIRRALDRLFTGF